VLKEQRERFDIERIGFDPWHADTLIDAAGQRGRVQTPTQVLAVPQTYQGMSERVLDLQAEILAGDVDAGGCPVTAWSVSNAVGQIGRQGAT
jgi:phage terminase large subunit-like protein